MKIKTSELIGPALDWAAEYIERKCEEVPALRGYNYDVEWRNKRTARYSADWAQGGPIIERERMSVAAHPDGHNWMAYIRNIGTTREGPHTPDRSHALLRRQQAR